MQRHAATLAVIAAAVLPCLAQAPQEERIEVPREEYAREGRRDPFLSHHDLEKAAREHLPPGVAGMRIDELDLQGIVVSGEERYAVVMGSDDKGYNLEEGDLLGNGRVLRIESDRVIFLRKVEDPLIPREFEQVVKALDPDRR